MTGSDNVQIPIDELHAIGSILQSLKNELETAHSTLSELTGEDNIHGAKIKEAVDEFFAASMPSRINLIQNVGNLGLLAVEIADKTASFDFDLTGELRKISDQLLPPKGPMQ